MKNVYPKASLGKRYLASFIDYAVLCCLFLVYIYSFGEQNEDGEYVVNGLAALIPLAFWFLYLVMIEGLCNATIGHFILGLKVIKVDNSRFNISDSFKRHLMDPIDFCLFGVPAIISIKNTTLNQRLGDLFAKTIVIEEK